MPQNLPSYRDLLRRLVEVSYRNGNTHMMSALTALPIIRKVYAERPDGLFVLSKGHAWYALAVVLEALGFGPNWHQTHPERDDGNGVLCTTGSLGHGLPIALGMALAEPTRAVSVLLGDGECQEGTTWECTNIISERRPANLHVEIDCNGWGATQRSHNRQICLLSADFPTTFRLHFGRRGGDIRLFQEHPHWHVHSITEAEYQTIMEECDAISC